MLALVEIKARFDEQATSSGRRKLEKAGVHVVYGLVGLKTHCKLALVVRARGRRAAALQPHRHGQLQPEDEPHLRGPRPAHRDDQVGKDLTRLFNELSGYAIEKKFKRLLVAPLHLRKGLLKRIDARDGRARERASRAASGSRSTRIVDEAIIDALYRASQAGVPVDLVVRGICSLRPGVPGLSENIRVRCILGRYLEHSRIFSFFNDGDPQVYIGSADMMHRNLDRRVEALVRLTSTRTTSPRSTSCSTWRCRRQTSSWRLEPDGNWTRHDRAETARRSPTCTMSSCGRSQRRKRVGVGR